MTMAETLTSIQSKDSFEFRQTREKGRNKNVLVRHAAVGGNK